MDFTLLVDRPDTIPRIAAWYHDEWGYLNPEESTTIVEENLRVYLERDRIPLIVLAVEGDDVAGCAQLKFREMDIYPEKEHWLGGVYVPAEHRGRGVASALVREAIGRARSLGVERLHLQTEAHDGGLYARLGWVPVERVTYRGVDVLVMENDLTG